MLAGPVGTGCARLTLAAIFQVPVLPLLAAALPGMVFTAACTGVLYPVFCRAMEQGGVRNVRNAG